ncbi:unnamed protein product [Durusdinium trenchii]|uniref:Uncharacterized protein n=1 Tax=Durusdinium trenchii TaxID=1381693 RepID=A0ABP0L4C7_9DINO
MAHVLSSKTQAPDLDPPQAFMARGTRSSEVEWTCRSGHRTAIPSCEEFRATLEVLLIRERCAEHVHFRWIPTTLMIADPLTKVMDSSSLRTTLQTGSSRIFDEAAVLRYNAHRKQALKWLRPTCHPLISCSLDFGECETCHESKSERQSVVMMALFSCLNPCGGFTPIELIDCETTPK